MHPTPYCTDIQLKSQDVLIKACFPVKTETYNQTLWNQSLSHNKWNLPFVMSSLINTARNIGSKNN